MAGSPNSMTISYRGSFRSSRCIASMAARAAICRYFSLSSPSIFSAIAVATCSTISLMFSCLLLLNQCLVQSRICVGMVFEPVHGGDFYLCLLLTKTLLQIIGLLHFPFLLVTASTA